MTAIAIELLKRFLPGAALVVGFIALGLGLYQLGKHEDAKVWSLKVVSLKSQHQAELSAVNASVSGLQAELSSQKAKAESDQRAIEGKWANDFQKVSEDAQKQIDRVAAGKRAADAVSGQLRQQARILAAACGAGPASAASQSAGAASASAAGFSPGLVLADVFGWADETAGELATAYDRARAAGLACERTHDALRGAK